MIANLLVINKFDPGYKDLFGELHECGLPAPATTLHVMISAILIITTYITIMFIFLLLVDKDDAGLCRFHLLLLILKFN